MKKLNNLFLAIILCAITNSCNKKSDYKTEATAKPVEKKQEVPAPIFKGDYCFLKAENKDSTTVRVRFLSNDDIRGEMIWSPWQKDGAVGTLTGKLNANNEMELLYNYTIEGNRQSETKVMKIDGDKLLIKQGELIDPKFDGNLVFKDVSKATYKTVLSKVNCN